jgi:hypothetical protein
MHPYDSARAARGNYDANRAYVARCEDEAAAAGTLVFVAQAAQPMRGGIYDEPTVDGKRKRCRPWQEEAWLDISVGLPTREAAQAIADRQQAGNAHHPRPPFYRVTTREVA